ncbi:hypothetical protein MJG53_015325 [Ovis ammon polii x Ovis aries]|uniref:Uncharacterized protein n=1 Tax=Ovis ammon polii x Ovis aries TaxID=2918886 RepID=A0ACB9UE98_9CETA|nr:hypothetical protein MJG53_015325 [Ovis ammon polii x Ovis aries]
MGNHNSRKQQLLMGIISSCPGYIKGPEQGEDTHTREHSTPLTTSAPLGPTHHHDRLLLRPHLLLPQLWRRLPPALLLPRPLLLPPSVQPDHREPPRDLRAPLHAPHLRALPPPGLLRPLQPAGGLLPPHHLLPHVVPGRGVPPLLLGHHVLPARLCAVPVLPPHQLPAGPLPHHLPHLQDLPLLLSSPAGYHPRYSETCGSPSDQMRDTTFETHVPATIN